MIRAVCGASISVSVCVRISYPVSCPSVGMEVLQARQLLINDLYQS